MGNCKDCRHWWQHGNEWNTCNAVDWVAFDEPIDASIAAIYADAHDDSGLDAGLKTGPMFGCVQFLQRALPD